MNKTSKKVTFSTKTKKYILKNKKIISFISCGVTVLFVLALTLGLIFGCSRKKIEISGEKDVIGYVDAPGGESFIATYSDGTEPIDFHWQIYQSNPKINFEYEENVAHFSWTAFDAPQTFNNFSISCMQGTDESTKVYFYFTFEIKDCIGNLSISGNLSPTVVSGVGDTIQYTVSPNVSYSIQDTITPDPNTETNTYIIVSHSHSVEDKLQIRVYGTTPINTYSIVITINSRGYYPATATISLSVVAS